jgi:dolichyl-phosphate-mannose-protein mannosyltransferase/tetratricopeptide repeat protein
MMLAKYIPPRRLILACLLLVGLVLRLWGLAWGPHEGGSPLPGEWGWRVIEHLSWSQPTYPGLWAQAFFSLAALFQGAVSFVAGLAQLLLGQVRTLAEVGISGLMAGRISVALLGAAQIPLVYLLGRRCFDSLATGMLAALLVALSPLLVAQSHYLALDTPLGFMVLLCAWLSWLVMESPRSSLFLGLGVVLGLTVTVKPAGMIMAPLVLTCSVLAAWRVRKERPRWILFWFLYLLAGLTLGLVLGSPALVLEWPEHISLDMSRFDLSALGQNWWQAIISRGQHAAGLWLGGRGLEVALLWLIALAILISRRQVRRCLIALTPLPFLLTGLLLPVGLPEGWLAVWLPAAAVAACWPLVLLCRRLPSYGWQLAAVAALMLALGTVSLWRSAGVGYLFWQQDTYQATRFWLRANLKPQARVLTGPGAPLDLFPTARPWGKGHKRDQIISQGDYLVVPGTAPAGTRRPAAPAARLLSTLQLVKRIDLKAGGQGDSWWLGSRFPAGVSPKVDIYAPLPPSRISQPLALVRPSVGYSRSYAVVYGQASGYSRDDSALLIDGEHSMRRVFRLIKTPQALGLRLANLGSELTEVKVSQGPWPGQKIILYPGQNTDMILDARSWPPMTNGMYPLRISPNQPGLIWAEMVHAPLLLTKMDMQSRRWARAVRWLELEGQVSDSFDARAMRAGALVRLGKFGEASRILAGLPGRVAREYMALVEIPPGPEWDFRFSDFTGYHLDMLRQAVSLTYRVGGPQCVGDCREVTWRGKGFHGIYQHPKKGKDGGIGLWLADPYPQGAWLAEFSLASTLKTAPDKRLAKLEVWVRGGHGARLLAEKWVLGKDLDQGRGVVALPLVNPWSGGKLEVRVDFTSAGPLQVESLRVGADLRAHMAWVLRWYHEAWGRVALQTGRHQAAVESFRSLLKLAPGYRPAYLPMARALTESGRLKEALAMVHKAERAFDSLPEQLGEVTELYKSLHKKADAARVGKRLAHLKPSLKRESRFEAGMTLLGYDLPKTKVKIGGKLDANFYWRAWGKVPWDYSVFLHLRGPKQTINFDHSLDFGKVSMTNLEPGQVVREDMELSIPSDTPAGKYQLVLGLWDPLFDREPMRVVAGQGEGAQETVLGEVEIIKPAKPKKAPAK